MAAIRFLKDDLLKVIEERIKAEIKPEEVSRVLTVPAIWDDGAKQFMREAAESAGISSDTLMIALESEAAAIYCRFLPAEKTEHEDSLSTFETGSKTLIVDAGGGTVDIAVQEVAENGSMKNIYKVSGGDWGGPKVDDAYVKFLEDILGKESIEEYKRSNIEDYLFMIREFELKKRSVDPSEGDKPVVLRVPFGLLMKIIRGKEIREVSIKADKLKVNASVVTNFFKAQVDAIVDQVSNIIEHSRIGDIAAVVLVGCFSNCHLLKEAMKTRFDNHKIIVPNEPDLTVLKGAVIFGHKPELISQRVSKYTYGVDINEEFIEQVHKASYKVIDEEGDSMCKNVFDKHITAGQCLIYGDAQAEKVYHPTRSSQCVISFPVYVTLDPVSMYVADEGCHIAVVLRVPLEGSGTDRSVRVRMIYGGTEIEVEATEDATGKVYPLKIDFLS